MNLFSALLASLLLVARTSSRASSAVAAASARARHRSVSLRGALAEVPLALVRLDPGWWKPTTSTVPPPVPKPTFENWTGNATGAAAGAASGASAATSIFDVQLGSCTPFLSVPGTFLTDVAYWKKECKAVPAGATYIKMTMGAVTDYFRPIPNRTMCDMLASGRNHFWSGDGKSWVYPNTSTAGLGGSADGWPSKHSPNDKRDALSFWGANGTQTGGCCKTDYTAAGKSWSKPYKMEYCGLPKSLAPVCTPLATVAGSFSADKAYWAQICKTIPMTTTFIKVAMDGLVDYFKPPTGKNYCDMLTASDAHKWSKDGFTWVKPSQYAAGLALGGSAMKGVSTADNRTNVSFWGSDKALETGGCCYASLADKSPGFGKSFTMSYCEVQHETPLAQFVQMLHSEEAAVEKMENEMLGFHSRLLTAESIGMDASGNVSMANSGMYKLAAKAKNEADEMKLIAMRSTMLKTHLNGADSMLKRAQDSVRRNSKKTAGTAAVARKTASPQGLKAQEDLNKQVWELMDPSNKDNLDATERRVRAMEKETAAFRKTLTGQIKMVMVTKLRRMGHRLRKAIHRLGNSAREGAKGLGLVESDAPLGADLGLDEE